LRKRLSPETIASARAASMQSSIRSSRAAWISCCGGPLQSSPERTVLVSATIRTEAFPALTSQGVDLGLDFVFAHGRQIERGKLGHGFPETLGGGIACFFVSRVQEVDEDLDFGHPLGRQVLELLDERLRIARVHVTSFPCPGRRFGRQPPEYSKCRFYRRCCAT